jgi:hypothetical protein
LSRVRFYYTETFHYFTGFPGVPATVYRDGENLSPGITLRELNALYVAIMVFNHFEKSCCSFTLWIIWNIPPVLQIPAGIPQERIATVPVSAV